MRFAILIYDEVEPIDLGATFGVLSMARRIAPEIEVISVARQAGLITCANGLEIVAETDYDHCPECDVLVVTGGPGWQVVAEDEATLKFLRSLPDTTLIGGICTGAMILAAAGLLDNVEATTKTEVIGAERQPLEILNERYPAIRTTDGVAVFSGNRFTSGGVSLGIDAIFYVLERVLGTTVAQETARIMEYSRALVANAGANPPRGFKTGLLRNEK